MTDEKKPWSGKIKVLTVDGPSPLKADQPEGTQILKMSVGCEDNTTKNMATFKKDLFQFLTTRMGVPFKADMETTTKQTANGVYTNHTIVQAYDDQGAAIAKKGSYGGGGGGMSAEAGKVLADGFVKAASIISLGNVLAHNQEVLSGEEDLLGLYVRAMRASLQASPAQRQVNTQGATPPKGQQQPQQPQTPKPQTPAPKQEPITQPLTDAPQNVGQLLQFAVNNGCTKAEVMQMLGVTDVTKITDIDAAYTQLYLIIFGTMPDGTEDVTSDQAFDNIPSGSMGMDL